MNVGIIGAGHIAGKMAVALNGIKDEVVPYAVASRTLEKAEAFKTQWGFKKAYGSYLELVSDPAIDLVYVATPHSEHYSNAKLCLEHGKSCLVEKAFCANLAQAKELVELARKNNLLLAEAMWTRYMPSRNIISNIINSGIIGDIESIVADFSCQISNKARILEPSLCGGALLDLGIYSLTVPIMYLGADIAKVEIKVDKLPTGVDAATRVNLYYNNGVVAYTKCSCVDSKSNYARFAGKNGYIILDSTSIPTRVEIYDNKGKKIDSIDINYRVNGYEYEVLECKRMLKENKIECVSMPLSETLKMMGIMDSIRYHAGIIYPFESDSDVNHQDIDIWGVEDVFI